MTETGDTREDIRVPEGDLGKELKTRYDSGEQLLVTIIAAMDEEMAIAVKNMPK